MKVKFKRLSDNAITPRYMHDSDSAMDLYATAKKRVTVGGYDNQDTKYIEYSTGISFEIPEGHVGLVFPRSSISDTDLTLTNSVGVIDSGYRGEIKARFRVTKNEVQYQVGDRVCQIIIIPFPKIELEEVVELNNTDRGANGFGSTGLRRS